VIWEPFVLALVLGLIISAGLYFAYLWPSVEPVDADAPVAPEAASRGEVDTASPPAGDDAASPSP
jgi:hypothetical protein